MPYRYYYVDRIREQVKGFKGTDEELQEAIDEVSLVYSSALREVETRLKILSNDFEKKHQYMPIHHVESRLKTFESILEKAERYGIEDPINNIDVIRREILDIAGLRVVCNYEEDLRRMSNLLINHEDIDMIKIKDYCDNPKPSGYRSLHVVVSCPVYLLNKKKIVPVEIQYRSIAMDAWASLEHELRYKNKGELKEDVVATLKECAETLHLVDEKMMRVRHEVLKDESEYSDY